MVTEAADGGHALALFKTAIFDVVLTDFSMPVLNGQLLAELIKFTAPLQRIVMLTGSPETLRWAGDKPQWIDLLLAKPITEQALNAALQALAGVDP